MPAPTTTTNPPTTTTTKPTTTTTTKPSTTTTTAPPGGGSATGDQNGPLGSCPVFPADNAWNTDVSRRAGRTRTRRTTSPTSSPTAATSSTPTSAVAACTASRTSTVAGTQPKVTDDVRRLARGERSRPVPDPAQGADRRWERPARARRSTATTACSTRCSTPRGPATDGQASNGAKWDLRSNALRPIGWTSADAAGLPIFAGLARYDEVASRAHRPRAALHRSNATQTGFVLPATHDASSSTDPNRPPMGLRLRLRGDYDLSRFHGQSRVILEALKKYGMIVADNGSNWYITGAADSRWNDDDLEPAQDRPGKRVRGRRHRPGADRTDRPPLTR